MKTATRIMAALLILMMVFAAGCQKTPDTDLPDFPGTSDTPDASAEPAADPAEEAAKALGVGLDEVAAVVNGDEITVREFLYWANATIGSWGVSDIDYDEDLGGVTLREVLEENVLDSVKLYRVVGAKSDELGITLSEEDEATIADAHANLLESYGSEEAYQAALSEVFLSEDLYNYMLRTSFLYSYLFEEMYGANGELISDEDALQFGEENGFLRAKHLLLSKTDADGNSLSDEEYEKRFEQMQGFIAMLDTSDDPAATFDELMNEYSEDPGLATAPDGYQWIEGCMDPSFEEAAKSLDYYGYSGVVEMSTYGYTIVMRLPLDPDEIAINDPYGYTLRMDAAMTIFDSLLSDWTQETSVEFKPAYEKLDYSKCF